MASPLIHPCVCPAGMEVCPLLEEAFRLREECQRLKELTQTDPLTGSFNRRHLMASLDREMERTRRTGLPACLIMIDLDLFKRLNDAYGHQFGDAVLRRVACLIKDNVRKLDIPCRYGGDEFAVVLPGTRLPQAVRLADRLRRKLTQAWVEPQGQKGQLTASFGVDTFTSREELTPEAFLQRADYWLFLAKSRGGNTVCHPDSVQTSGEAGLSQDERRAFLRAHNLSDKVGESYG